MKPRRQLPARRPVLPPASELDARPAPVSKMPGRVRNYSPKEFAAEYNTARQQLGIYCVSPHWVYDACTAIPPRIAILPGLGRILIPQRELERLVASLPKLEAVA